MLLYLKKFFVLILWKIVDISYYFWEIKSIKDNSINEYFVERKICKNEFNRLCFNQIIMMLYKEEFNDKFINFIENII